MPNIAEFLQTYLGLAQLVTQQQQFQQRALLETEAASRDAIQDFQAIAAQTPDPDQRHALARRFERSTGMSSIELLNLAPPPEAGVIQRWLSREAFVPGESPSPALEGREDLLSEVASLTGTGMGRGQAEASGFLGEVFGQAREQGVPEGLPQEAGIRAAGVGGNIDLLTNLAAGMLPQGELIQGAGIQTGTRMSAAQDASNQLGWANNRLGWASLLQRGQGDSIENMLAGLKPDELIPEIGKTIRFLQENKGNMSEQELEMWRIYLNTLARQGEKFNFQFKQINSIEEILQPGWAGYPGLGR